MAWWMAAPLALNAASSIASVFGGNSAARQLRRETDEQLRRKELQDRATLGEARARGAASGVEAGSGSLVSYLDEMDAEFTRQREWMKQAGYSRARSTENSAMLGALTGGASALFQFGASNNWWKQPQGGVK